MTEAAKELASSGAVGAGFVLVLMLLFWVVKVLVTNATKQMDSMTKGMEELVSQSRAIRDNCLTCRSDSLATLRDAEAKISAHVWQAHDKGVQETERMLDAIVGKLDRVRLEERVDELSRPHPLTPAPLGKARR